MFNQLHLGGGVFNQLHLGGGLGSSNQLHLGGGVFNQLHLGGGGGNDTLLCDSNVNSKDDVIYGTGTDPGFV